MVLRCAVSYMESCQPFKTTARSFLNIVVWSAIHFLITETLLSGDRLSISDGGEGWSVRSHMG